MFDFTRNYQFSRMIYTFYIYLLTLHYQGVGDYLAASYSRSKNKWTPENPEYNWAFSWDGHNEFWDGRITNYYVKYPDGLTGDLHTDGQIWSSCNMKIWEEIGRKASDKVQLVGLSYTGGSSNQDDLANAVIAAARDLDYPILYIAKIIEAYTECGYDVSCGNGIREGNEECDGYDIGDATCMARGCVLGVPKCTSSCELDYSECIAGEGQIQLEAAVTFDKYPQENWWELRDSRDAILYSKSNYKIAQTTVREQMCIENDCYSFYVFDKFEDGMCCEYGMGGYKLIYNGTVIMESNFPSGSSTYDDVGICATNAPSLAPSTMPSASPSVQSSTIPSGLPSDMPSEMPSAVPSSLSSNNPSKVASTIPSVVLSDVPSATPSALSSVTPSDIPSAAPSSLPSTDSSKAPSAVPTLALSTLPSVSTSAMPSAIPSEALSEMPSLAPSSPPIPDSNTVPSAISSRMPSEILSASPSSLPGINS